MAVKGCRALYVHWETIDFRIGMVIHNEAVQGSVHIHLIQINSHEIRLTKKLWGTVCGATDETCGCASAKHQSKRSLTSGLNWVFSIGNKISL